MEKRVAVGMSGGVDSSTTVHILKERGYEVHGVFLHFAHNADDLEKAEKVANKVGITLHVVHCEKEFEKVPQLVVDGYRQGITPNPCANCNFMIKFSQLIQFADSMEIKFVATGHYAKCIFDNELNSYIITRGESLAKDQSYALFHLKMEWLPRLIFPCGDFESKSEIRQIAASVGLEQASFKDSQEICFLQSENIEDYRVFLRRKAPELFVKGNLLNEEGEIIGEHEGYCNFTIGQRRGLGNFFSHKGEKLFVRKIDPTTGNVMLGKRPMARELMAKEANWMIDLSSLPEELLYQDSDEALTTKFRAGVQIRYQARKAVPSVVTLMRDDHFKVEFEEEVFAATPGQPAVVYLGTRMIGGGFITLDF